MALIRINRTAILGGIAMVGDFGFIFIFRISGGDGGEA